MTRPFARFALAVAATLLVLPAAPSLAANPCVKDAAAEHRDCKADCKEDLQVAKDACLDRDHECVEVCRAKRSECRDATGIDAALAACNASLYDARKTCRETHPAGSPERDACVDQAQVVAFACRDTARENAKDALKVCRKEFRTCARACAKNDPPQVGDVKQCKLDAVAAYKACKGECREEFQVAKDGCKNRDHVCAEGCREERDECRQPIRDMHAAAVDACNAERDEDKATCDKLYAAGTPEHDTCVDQAQVEAFQCRDDAREAARPGLQGCRDAFRTCVQACPPPAP
jgi:hypothetical protein